MVGLIANEALSHLQHKLHTSSGLLISEMVARMDLVASYYFGTLQILQVLAGLSMPCK